MDFVPKRLTAETIEQKALVLLLQCFPVLGMPQLPIPVEEIVEHCLGLHLELGRLHDRGLPEADGATDIDARTVYIDERLDPVEHPEMEGRYRYTIAHEIAHWFLHRLLRYIHALGRSVDPSLIASYRELEWQADKFASYLLMPRQLVLREWQRLHGQTGPLIITPQTNAAGIENFGSRANFLTAFTEFHAAPLAIQFKVSISAMRIRLQELGLLPRV